MAANMKAVKLRIKSVETTMQTTRAMQLVAASKLRKAKEKADASKPYLKTLKDTLAEIAHGNLDFGSPYTKPGKNEKWLYIVIAGDRGMAGGYNSNLFKFMESEIKGRDISVLPIGKKSVEYFKHHNVPIYTEAYAEVAKVSINDCFEIGRLICRAYSGGEFGHIFLCYTNFVSMLSQVPEASSMLPLSDFVDDEETEEVKKTRDLILYEPDSETVFNAIVPEYLAGLLYSGINVSVASELAARRTAMESATDNAAELIEELYLYYNRARQAGITQEITEIVAGAEEA